MSFLITADWHRTNNPRDVYRDAWQKELRDLVRKHRPEAVLVLGDIADARDEHPAALVYKMVNDLYRLSALAPVIVLQGNHDNTSSGEPSFWAFLSRIEGIVWVGEATAVPGTAKSEPLRSLAPLGRVLFLPHTHDYEADWAGFEFRGLDWVFTHVTFAGARGESGHPLSGVPPAIFPAGVKVISGDVHAAQTFGAITYVGAPYLVRFGDSYGPRVLLLKDGKMQSIPTTGPQKRLITLGTDGQTIRGEYNPGDIVKIQVPIRADEYANWNQIKSTVALWAQDNQLQLHMIRPVIESKRMDKKRVASSAPKSDKQILEAYAARREIDERTLAVGMNLLEE